MGVCRPNVVWPWPAKKVISESWSQTLKGNSIIVLSPKTKIVYTFVHKDGAGIIGSSLYSVDMRSVYARHVAQSITFASTLRIMNDKRYMSMTN